MTEGTGTVWKDISFYRDIKLHWKFNTFQLYFQKDNEKLRIAHQILHDSGNSLFVKETVGHPDELEWSEYYSSSEIILSLLPALPDKPVLFHPEASVAILPKTEQQFYVDLPVWVQIQLKNGTNNTIIFEEPMLPMSQTWFGANDNGELAYHYRSWIDSGFPSAPGAGIIVPLLINNQSDTVLNLDNLCLRTIHLHVFNNDDWLLSNQIAITFKGEEQISNVEYSNNVPSYIPGMVKINEARISHTSGILKRSFQFIRSI